ncbi:MAG: helix-turn-helix transcriptional regulator [Ruminococcaceae bacterium]|nr:helix-turn-helix transcriptional regulator [Oscillospiraceae bacterium]
MLSIMSKSPAACPPPRIVLTTIWKVEADETYHGRYWDNHESNMIAISTIGGIGEVEVNGTVHQLTAGSLLVFRYSDMRYYEPLKDHWDFYWFEFEGGVSALPLGVTVNAGFDEKDVADMEYCFRSLPVPSDAAYISTFFSALLLKWIRGYQYESDEEKKLVSDTVDHIMNNPDVSIADLAKRVHIGEQTFRNLFKTYMGVSPQAYISEMRIKNAEELLMTTAMTVKEIGYALGFQNQYYFSSFFKKKKGVSPCRFRKRKKY